MENDVFSVKGKATVVTGAAMGIGFSIAKRFVEAGAKVLLVDMNEQALRTACDKLALSGGQASSLAIDVGGDNAGDRIVSTAIEKLGGIDVLVNNAGVYPQQPLLKLEPSLLDKVLRVNLRGLILISKAAGQFFAGQKRGGAIVNIASIDSVHPSMVGLAAYDASKGGVLSFTKNFALEMSPHKVRVNAILPGGISTEGTKLPLEGSGMSPDQMKAMIDGFTARIPMHRMGNPDEIATVAQFLASPAASYMTGAAVLVDGGMLLS